MSGSYVHDVGVFLGTDPADVRLDRWSSEFGPRAVIRIAGGLSLHVSDASPELLRALAAVATELAEWREQQIATGEQVAA